MRNRSPGAETMTGIGRLDGRYVLNVTAETKNYFEKVMMDIEDEKCSVTLTSLGRGHEEN
jgi:hypothetical protein